MAYHLWSQPQRYPPLVALSPHRARLSLVPTLGAVAKRNKGSQLPSPVGVAPNPGAGAAFQSIHHCVPIVQKGFVQPGVRVGYRKSRVDGLDNDSERTNGDTLGDL